MDAATLRGAMRGQDVVYANLAGPMAQQASAIIEAMHAEGVKRLIFISPMGIDREVPGQRYRSVLDPYRDSAALIATRAACLAASSQKKRNVSA